MKYKENYLLSILIKVTWPKLLIFTTIIISIISTILTLSIPYLTGIIVNQSTSDNRFNMKYLILMGVLFLITTIFNGVNIYLLSKIGEEIVFSIKSEIWSHLLRLPATFHDNNSSGNLMSRVTDDTDIISIFISDRMPSVIPSILTLIGSFIILLSLSWQLTIIIFILIPLFFMCLIPLGKIIEKNSVNIQNKISEFNGLLGRVLNEIKLVKTSSSELLELKRGRQFLQDIYKLQLKEARIKAMILPLTGTLLMIILSMILIYGGTKVAENSISSGALISIIFYIIQLIAPISNLSTLTTEYNKALGASKKLFEIYKTEPEHFNNSKREFNNNFKSITFENVSFYYDKNIILDDISFTINKGENIAVIGPSGSGKTTIFDIIERLYKINKGKILIDGVNIEDINLTSWRKSFGYVSQSNPIMFGSIKENLLYGFENDIEDKVLYRYLEDTKCIDFIEKLPGKLNYQVGDKGSKLSGGQMQKINITRNLIRNPEIILFDEPTSNLDSDSEYDIQNSMNKLLKNRTSITISHKMSTIKNADKIIFIDHGKITGIGTHQYLLSNHSKYRKFVNSQRI